MTNTEEHVSVWLDEKQNVRNRRLFRCIECGKGVFEYYSQVRILLPGDTEFVSGHGVVIHCRGSWKEYDMDGINFTVHCKKIYVIN